MNVFLCYSYFSTVTSSVTYLLCEHTLLSDKLQCCFPPLDSQCQVHKIQFAKSLFSCFFFNHWKERERERECVCVCVCIALDEVNNKGMKWGEIKIELMHLHFSTHTHTWTPPRPRPPARYHATSSRRLKRSITLEREVVGVGGGVGGL